MPSWFARAQARIPGGVNSPVRAFGSVGGKPFFVAGAHGAYLVDTEGGEYLDYVQSLRKRRSSGALRRRRRGRAAMPLRPGRRTGHRHRASRAGGAIGACRQSKGAARVVGHRGGNDDHGAARASDGRDKSLSCGLLSPVTWRALLAQAGSGVATSVPRRGAGVARLPSPTIVVPPTTISPRST
jgi:hypothetical protein